MFSPLDDTRAEEWFRRFDAATRRLPVEERASQREEIQQHLEGLVAANEVSGQPHDEAWKAALEQFGDPTQLGRKMYREWQQGRIGFRADMKAILFGTGVMVLWGFVVRLVLFLWGTKIYAPGEKLYTHGQGLIALPFVIYLGLTYGAAVLINAAIGRRYPFQAIKGALYTYILENLWSWCSVIIIVSIQHCNSIAQLPSAILTSTMLASTMFAHVMLLAPFWFVGSVTVAYLASVTKRGWYRPSLADFKLTLRHRRPQLSR